MSTIASPRQILGLFLFIFLFLYYDINNIWLKTISDSKGSRLFITDWKLAQEDQAMVHMKDQCLVEDIKFTRPEGSSTIYEHVICPTIAATHPKFICNKSSTFSYALLAMEDFIHFLEDKNFTILYVGDSLQEQMYHAFLCAVEAEEALVAQKDQQVTLLLERSKRRVQYSASYFLARLPPECIVTRPKFNVTSLQNEDWFQVATRQSVTHIVFNTGAWFTPSGIHIHNRKATREQTRLCFERHLVPGSRLYYLLHILSEQYNIEMIWRDVSPAGICNTKTHQLEESKYTNYYNDFQYYNKIGRNVTVNLLKGLVVPDVYETSMKYWREHMSASDTMHWCSFMTYNVPSVWNTKLFQLLLSQTKPDV